MIYINDLAEEIKVTSKEIAFEGYKHLGKRGLGNTIDYDDWEGSGKFGDNYLFPYELDVEHNDSAFQAYFRYANTEHPVNDNLSIVEEIIDRYMLKE